MQEALVLERDAREQRRLIYKVEQLLSMIREHKEKLIVIGYNSSG